MASVGERLRLLRESRNTTLEEMVTATGIGQGYLEALERGAIHELPGKAFGKLYIRAYAEVFTFDPQPFIDDYDREQRLVAGASAEPMTAAPAGSRPVAAAIAQWKAARVAAEKPEPVVETDEEVVPEPTAPPETPVECVVPEPEVGAPPAKRRLAPVVLVGVVALAAAIYIGTRPTDDGNMKSEQPTVHAIPELPPPEAPPPVVVPPQPPPTPPAKAPVTRETPAGALSVTEFGVGHRIVNLKLEGESNRFEPGTRVCFSTRVVGGQRGGVVRHAWLYEGRTEQTITLRLGGPDWRTHSNKTLGRAGAWAVEARDEKGRVLARVEFGCQP